MNLFVSGTNLKSAGDRGELRPFFEQGIVELGNMHEPLVIATDCIGDYIGDCIGDSVTEDCDTLAEVGPVSVVPVKQPTAGSEVDDNRVEDLVLKKAIVPDHSL